MTLHELFDLRNDSSLRNRVSGACLNMAKTILLESPETAHHLARITWALLILDGNGEDAPIKRVFRAITVLLQEDGSASDETIQTAVNQTVNTLTALEV